MKKVCAMVLLFSLTFGVQVWATAVGEELPARQEMPVEAPAPQEQTPPQGQMPTRGERPQGQMPPQGVRPQGQMPLEQDRAQPVEAEATMTENSEENAVIQPGGAESESLHYMMGKAESPLESKGVFGFLKTYATSVVSVVLLIGAFLFVKLYKRKMY